MLEQNNDTGKEEERGRGYPVALGFPRGVTQSKLNFHSFQILYSFGTMDHIYRLVKI